MPSKRFDITDTDDVFAGEHKFVRISVVNAAGAPYNMTGKTLEWVLRKGARGAVVLTKTTTAAQITLGNDAGTGDLAIIELLALDTIDALDAFLIEPGKYFHTLRQTPSLDEAVLCFGDFTLKAPATR